MGYPTGFANRQPSGHLNLTDNAQSEGTLTTRWSSQEEDESTAHSASTKKSNQANERNCKDFLLADDFRKA